MGKIINKSSADLYNNRQTAIASPLNQSFEPVDDFLIRPRFEQEPVEQKEEIIVLKKETSDAEV